MVSLSAQFPEIEPYVVPRTSKALYEILLGEELDAIVIVHVAEQALVLERARQPEADDLGRTLTRDRLPFETNVPGVGRALAVL
jgi:hypothetical protein